MFKCVNAVAHATTTLRPLPAIFVALGGVAGGGGCTVVFWCVSSCGACATATGETEHVCMSGMGKHKGKDARQSMSALGKQKGKDDKCIDKSDVRLLSVRMGPL